MWFKENFLSSHKLIGSKIPILCDEWNWSGQNIIHLTLEPHGFELRGSTQTWISFPINTCTVFSIIWEWQMQRTSIILYREVERSWLSVSERHPETNPPWCQGTTTFLESQKLCKISYCKVGWWAPPGVHTKWNQRSPCLNILSLFTSGKIQAEDPYKVQNALSVPHFMTHPYGLVVSDWFRI